MGYQNNMNLVLGGDVQYEACVVREGTGSSEREDELVVQLLLPVELIID